MRDLYRIWRCTPLVRAYALERALDTPAKIYFKNESVSPAGSHKPNTALPQAYYNAKQGIKHLTTETGGGQWGSAIALASQYFGLDLKVFMVKVSYEQKPYRKLLMNTWGSRGDPLAQHADRRGTPRSGRRSRLLGQPRAGDLRGGRDSRTAPPTTRATAWAAY